MGAYNCLYEGAAPVYDQILYIIFICMYSRIVQLTIYDAHNHNCRCNFRCHNRWRGVFSLTNQNQGFQITAQLRCYTLSTWKESKVDLKSCCSPRLLYFILPTQSWRRWTAQTWYEDKHRRSDTKAWAMKRAVWSWVCRAEADVGRREYGQQKYFVLVVSFVKVTLS